MVALIFIWYILFLYGDIQVDPGPKSRTSQDCSFYHWNFNSITACSFLEILFLILLYAIHKFDNFFLKLILIQAFIVITKICLSPDTLWLEWIIWKCQTWWNSNLPSKLTRPESFLKQVLKFTADYRKWSLQLYFFIQVTKSNSWISLNQRPNLIPVTGGFNTRY